MPLRKWLLYLAAGASGFATMAIELLMTRLFAPYFGAGLNTWSSVIGATLLYLSLGYRRGGRMVDQKPEVGLLSRCFFVASGATLAIPFVLFVVVIYPPIGLAGFPLGGVGFYLQPLLLSLLLLYCPMTRLGWQRRAFVQLLAVSSCQKSAI